MLPFVIVWMSMLFGFAAGKIVYAPPTVTPPVVSELDTVHDVATTHIDIR